MDKKSHSHKRVGCNCSSMLYIQWPLNWGAHFINDFSIAFQIWWKIGFSVTRLYGTIALPNFAHATTAHLSCHVQNFITITSVQHEWNQTEISVEYELRWKYHSWNKLQASIRWFSARLQYLQCFCTGDTAVLHKAIDCIIKASLP